MSLTHRGEYFGLDGEHELGFAVYLDGNTFKKADATDVAPLFQVVGLTAQFTTAEGTGTVDDDVVVVRAGGTLYLPDWTEATGSQFLAPNKEYYLDEATPGKITLTRPVASGSKVISVGVARNTTYLVVDVKFYGEIP